MRAGLTKGEAMRHHRILGLLALTVAIVTILPGSAWAASLTSPGGTVATGTIEGSGDEELVTIDLASFGISIPARCSWAFSGEVKQHGEGQPISIALSSLSITSCATPSWHVTVVNPGTLTITATTETEGTVVWDGATIEVTWGSLQCRYKTESTDIGTFTSGTPGTIHLAGSLLFDGGAFACELNVPQARPLTGSLRITKPSSLLIDKTDTFLTSPTGTVVQPTIKAESEGHISLDHPLVTVQCKWSFEGAVKERGGNTVVPLSSLTTSGCTDSWHATTVAAGKLEIAGTSEYNGTVTWSGGTVEMTRLGTTCRYKSASTHLGTITGGSPATMHVEGKLPFHSGSPLCGEEAYSLTGSFEATSPSALFVDKAA